MNPTTAMFELRALLSRAEEIAAALNEAGETETDEDRADNIRRAAEELDGGDIEAAIIILENMGPG